MARAFVAAVVEYDFPHAEALIKKALSTSPNKALVIDWYLVVALVPQRRLDEAVVLLREVEQADPLSALVKSFLGTVLHWQGRNEEALAKFRETHALNPMDILSRFTRPIAEARLRRFDEAAASLELLDELVGEHDMALAARALVQIEKGELAEAEKTRQRQIALFEGGVVSTASRIGDVTARLGRIGEAVEWYERAEETDTYFKLWIPVYNLDLPALMAHPDFQAVLAKMNLDDASIAALEAAEAGE